MAHRQHVQGVYRNGFVELAERPSVPDGTVVTVSFSNDTTSSSTRIRVGMFPGPPYSTEEDFKEAEFHDADEET